MLTSNTQFEAGLKKRIAEEIERLQDVLETGSAVKDFGDYRSIAGQLSALRRVVDSYCGEVTETLNKR